MHVDKHTFEAPKPHTAYQFNMPTGGMGSGRSPMYRGWTPPAVFQGNWVAAAEFGVLRSEAGEKAENWPSTRVFRFPDDVFNVSEDPIADALLRTYARNLRECLARHRGEAGFSVEECRLQSAEGAQRTCNG